MSRGLKFSGGKNRVVIKQELPGHKHFTLSEFVLGLFKKPVSQDKIPVTNPDVSPIPSTIKVNHIAIVIDGKVQDVIRAQNRLAAMLLSEPTFIEFNPEDTYPIIGKTLVVDGEFVTKAIENENEED